ncbi:hypothetical protein P3L10_013063 [Capsicum annuum]
MVCSSKAFVFVCLSLAILSIILSSHAAIIPDIPPVNILPRAADDAKDAKDAAKKAERAIDLSKDAADYISNMASTNNIVTIAVTVVSLVTSLAFAFTY